MIIFRIVYSILSFIFKNKKENSMYEVTYKIKEVVRKTVIPSKDEKTVIITIASFEEVQASKIEIITIKKITNGR